MSDYSYRLVEGIVMKMKKLGIKKILFGILAIPILLIACLNLFRFARYIYRPWYIEDLLRKSVPKTSQIESFYRSGTEQVLIKISGPEEDYHYWLEDSWLCTGTFNEKTDAILLEQIQNIPESYKGFFLLNDKKNLKESYCCNYTDFRNYRTYFVVLELNSDNTYQLYVIRNYKT